jgi:hypothetical protein
MARAKSGRHKLLPHTSHRPRRTQQAPFMKIQRSSKGDRSCSVSFWIFKGNSRHASLWKKCAMFTTKRSCMRFWDQELLRSRLKQTSFSSLNSSSRIWLWWSLWMQSSSTLPCAAYQTSCAVISPWAFSLLTEFTLSKTKIFKPSSRRSKSSRLSTTRGHRLKPWLLPKFQLETIFSASLTLKHRKRLHLVSKLRWSNLSTSKRWIDRQLYLGRTLSYTSKSSWTEPLALSMSYSRPTSLL